MRTRYQHPRFFEIEEFSDYREPSYTKPLMVCLVVVVVALLAFCVCKKLNEKPSRGGCGMCTAAKAAVNQGGGDGVVHAKNAEHLEELLGSEKCVCLFWAPWCGHCAQMKPEYDKAASEHASMMYVACNCEDDVGHETLQKHGIEAFPTIRMYTRGRLVEEHSGPRDKDSIVSWASSHD